MQAIEIEAEIDDNGEIRIQLPEPRQPGHARVIVLFDNDRAGRSMAMRRHRPSPRLYGKDARLHGDDIAPALSPEEWGDLYP